MIAVSKDEAPRSSQAERRRSARKARERFLRARKAEGAFSRQLKAVARNVGAIVRGFAPKGVVLDQPQLMQSLQKYSDLLRPWARAVSAKMIAEVDQRDANAWAEMARAQGVELRTVIRSTPTGQAMLARMAEQVDLITSLPTKAGQRVHKLTIEAMTEGTRAKEIAHEILRTGHVTESRAMLIARTEVARTASTMTETRAKSVGSEGYFWRSVEDSDVRPIHKKLNGKFIRWDEPPIAGENGERAHAGQIYNCRCYPEPVLPDMIG